MVYAMKPLSIKKLLQILAQHKKSIVAIAVISLGTFAYAATQTTENPNIWSRQVSASTTPMTRELVVEIEFIPTEKVRAGIVAEIEPENDSFILQVGKERVLVRNNASTTFYLGDGTETSSSELAPDLRVYVFGRVSKDKTTVSASKIVIANISKLMRK
jgi:hypothetical protein